jgi:hypothetical protein
MFESDAENLDIVLLEKFAHVIFTKPHRVVSDVNLMSGPKMTSHGYNHVINQVY